MKFSKSTFFTLEPGKMFKITDSVMLAGFIEHAGGNRFTKLADSYQWNCHHRETGIFMTPNAICMNKGTPCRFPPEIEITELSD